MVDAYNRISLRHLLPIGGYDLDAVTGDIHLTRAAGGEQFEPLPPGSAPEEVDAGEVVYRDDKRVLTRRWNYRDSAATSIQPASTAVVLVAELPDATVPADVLSGVVDELAAALEGLGGQVTARFALTATAPEAELAR